ncbi:MAG TPA: pyridoxal-5'-phosphate-dependent protein subunit beta, partial [Myxococcaceae bacterium]|nr:pyridoxal-5'-phosphate-dependent protein subunit beta [Myxococcaceae bacterium]
LVANKTTFSDSIDNIVAPLQGVVSPDTSLNRLREVVAQDKVAVVKDGEKVLAIVTKIDLIEHLHQTTA